MMVSHTWYHILLTYNSITFIFVWTVGRAWKVTHPIYLAAVLSPVREFGGLQMTVVGGADYHGEVTSAVLYVVRAEDDGGDQQEGEGGEDHDGDGQPLLMLFVICVCLNTQQSVHNTRLSLYLGCMASQPNCLEVGSYCGSYCCYCC